MTRDNGDGDQGKWIQIIDRVADELFAGWQRAMDQENLTFAHRDSTPMPSRFMAVYGLATHTHLLGEQFFRLSREGLEAEALPMLRLMYESSITAAWLVEADDSLAAFANETDRERRNALAQLAKSSSASLRDVSKMLDNFERTEIATGSDPQARKFWARCHDFQKGDDLYINYVQLCRYGHPTAYVIDLYLEPTCERTAAHLLDRPHQARSVLWGTLAAACLIWSGSAMNHIDPIRARRAELRRASRQIPHAFALELTPEARQRIVSARRDANRAKWVGRKPRQPKRP